MNVQRFVLEAESEESGQGKDDWWIVFRARFKDLTFNTVHLCRWFNKTYTTNYNKMWTYDFLELKYLCYCSFQASKWRRITISFNVLSYTHPIDSLVTSRPDSLLAPTLWSLSTLFFTPVISRCVFGHLSSYTCDN